MVRIAHERIDELFALAGREAQEGEAALANRYVTLARRIGTRYNVRLPPEYRELYCRRCSVFWVEGRTVRSRLRSGWRVRTCLACGSVRRVRRRVPSYRSADDLSAARSPVSRDEGAIVLVPKGPSPSDTTGEQE